METNKTIMTHTTTINICGKSPTASRRRVNPREGMVRFRYIPKNMPNERFRMAGMGRRAIPPYTSPMSATIAVMISEREVDTQLIRSIESVSTRARVECLTGRMLYRIRSPLIGPSLVLWVNLFMFGTYCFGCHGEISRPKITNYEGCNWYRLVRGLLDGKNECREPVLVEGNHILFACPYPVFQSEVGGGRVGSYEKTRLGAPVFHRRVTREYGRTWICTHSSRYSSIHLLGGRIIAGGSHWQLHA